ncbi:MAG: carboxypeptidase regulatory-like domain-containing protein [Vicinamibacterales bacterium]
MLIRTIVWLLVFLLTVGQQATLLASDYFGKVTFNGLAVPGATVTATKADAKTSATTDAEGIYHLADLADGFWTLTIELFGFETITREIKVPTNEEPPPDALIVRSYDELTRALPPARVFESADESDDEPLDLTVLTGPAGMGAADGLLINGSMNNGASTRFALPRGIGNNRPRPPGVYSYAAGFQMGSSAWDARPFSLIGSGAAKPSYADTQALGTFQGPIRVRWLRNPINLMLGYQGTSGTNVTTQSTRMPTALERAGDFSQTFDATGQPVRLIDPATGQAFEGSAIPAGRISPQAAALLGYYPSADTAADGRFNYEAPVVSASRQDSGQARAGYTLRGENRVEGGVSYQRGSGRSTSLFGFEDSRASSGLTANGTLTLRPARNMTLSLRYQYSRSSNESLPYFANRVNVSGDAGINGNDQDPRNWGPPGLSFASDLAGLSSGSYALTRTTTQLWGADFSRFRGNHNLGLGIEARAIRNDVIGQQDPRGTFGFTGAVTGLDFADFLLGLPQTSTIGFGNPDKAFRGQSYAAFVNDEWRIRPNLTLTYGVRWEYETPITEAQGRLANLDVAPGFSAVNLVTASGGSDALVRPDRSGLQPRLGIAWRPTLGSLVIRGGYGIYRNLNIYQSIATLLAAQPPFATTFNVASTPVQPLTLANGFIPVNGTSNTFAIDPEFRTASAHTWQVSVQRELPAQMTLLGTYLGTRGTNLMQQILPNTYPAGAENECQACPVGFRYLASYGRSMRNSAQIQVRRRLSAGFTAATEYTLAKSMDDAASFGGATLNGGALVQNWLDPHAEYARSSFDQRHLVTVSADYTTGSGIAGGTLLDGMRGRLLKDWTLTARLSAGSGLPVTPVYFAPVAGTGVIGSLRPDLTGIANDAPDGAYANRAAFTAPAAGQWGSAPRNSITGPRTFSLDASVARTFRVNNRVSLDWRIDAANVLNRVTYAGINALITSPQFGLPNRANEMRKIRTSLRMRF